MKEKNIPFDQLEEAVLCQLKEHGYMDSTLTIYRRTFNRIHRFLSDSGKENYLPETGDYSGEKTPPFRRSGNRDSGRWKPGFRRHGNRFTFVII